MRRSYNRGEESGKSKLKREHVLSIRRKKKEGISYGKLAMQYGVSRACIQSVVYGITWKHLK